MRRYSFIGSFFIFNLIFLSIKTSIAQNGEYAGYVPSELKSWERWVKESDSNYTCARMEISRNCFWQGDLTINVVDSGAEFISKVVLDKEGYVSLPGGNDIWPIDVKAESNSIRQVPIVLTGEDVQRISGSSSPMAYLPAGQWTITGMFSWKIKPATIVVPQGVGLLNLTIDGARVLNPKVEDNGTLWIGETKQDAKSDLNPDVKQDYVSLVVLRKFEDGVPIKLETRLKLSVSGKERTIDLGRVLPVGFSIVRVDSSLPYQLSSEDKLVVQVGAGRHEIVLHGYSLISLDKIQAPQNTALLWPEQETWVWVGNESYRAVQVEGVTATDPSRTEIPSAWRRFPTYQIPNKTVMTLKELRRGETSLSPNEILVNRTLWLSESGESFIARDRLNGMLYKSFRLNANERNDLGSIQQNGQNLLITLDPTTNKKGVELRGQLVGLIGISEIKDPYKSMTAVGWEEDAKSLSMKLMLPPGWKLFHASGVNKLQNSWFGSWTPWDIFIVLLMALATFKVLGAGAGVLAAFVLVIIHGELSNSFFIWILLIATVALMRALPEGRVKVVLKYIDIVLKVCLAFILVGFCLNQIKDLIYPQLALEGSVTASAMHFLGASGVINFFGFFGFILFVFFGIWYFVLLFRRAWAKAFLTLGGLILFVSVGVGINRAYVGRGIHGMAKPPSSAMESTGDYSRYDMKDRKTSKSFISDPYQEQQSINVITPKSNEFLQTGPALPQWRHRVYSFFWNYSVSKDHEIRFYLISPAMNCVLSIIRIVLVVLLGYCFIRPRRLSMPRNAMLVFLCALIFCPNIVLAENYPSRELLDDLKQRMARNECHNDCVKAQNLDVNISDNNARFVVDVHSHGINAYAIPGPAREFRPERIKLDGVDYNAVIKRDDGFIWVRIPSGIHRIEFERNLSGLNMLELEFVDVPGQVKIQSNEWYQEGINENNSLITKALRLIRQENIKKNINNASEKIESVFALGSWFTVRRKIDFGVQWRIVNIAEREGLVDRAESVAIDLLDGEEVSNRDVRVEKNKAIVSFPVGVKRVEWNSLLKEKEQIFLFANNVERLSEKWEIFCSALYQCEYRGISPTTSIENGKSIRSYEPWPGEKVEVGVKRPESAPGVSTTIQSIGVDYIIGEALLDTTLKYQVHSTSGGYQTITIPAESEVEIVLIDDKKATIASENGKLKIPLGIGKQRVQIDYRDKYKQGIVASMPVVGVGVNGADVNYNLNIPENRWLIWAYGPNWGPAIMFWPKLFLILILSILAARFIPVKIGFINWLLLGFGFATLPIGYVAIVPIWLVVLNYKGMLFKNSRMLYNLGQIVIITLTIGVLVCAYLTVLQGLIVRPDMEIRGIGSSSNNLHWYADKTDQFLPAVGIISLPLFIYRIVMFLWSAWFAYTLVSWLRNAWDKFSTPTLWQSSELGVPDK